MKKWFEQACLRDSPWLWFDDLIQVIEWKGWCKDSTWHLNKVTGITSLHRALPTLSLLVGMTGSRCSHCTSTIRSSSKRYMEHIEPCRNNYRHVTWGLDMRSHEVKFIASNHLLMCVTCSDGMHLARLCCHISPILLYMGLWGGKINIRQLFFMSPKRPQMWGISKRG